MDWNNIPNPESFNHIMRKMKFCPECGSETVDFTEERDRLDSRICPDDHATFTWGEDRLGDPYVMVITNDVQVLWRSPSV